MKPYAALAAFCFAAALTAPASAMISKFIVDLNGSEMPTPINTDATGEATIFVDNIKQTISLTLTVKGISLDQLRDSLVAAPIGPVHLHHYPEIDHTKPQDVTLALPVPYAGNYVATADGFKATLTNYPYAEGAKLVGSKMDFRTFLRAMEGGDLVLNIHTDKFPDGEISGVVVPEERY